MSEVTLDDQIPLEDLIDGNALRFDYGFYLNQLRKSGTVQTGVTNTKMSMWNYYKTHRNKFPIKLQDHGEDISSYQDKLRSIVGKNLSPQYFDTNYYLSLYPDVADFYKGTPFNIYKHWQCFGVYELRDFRFTENTQKVTIGGTTSSSLISKKNRDNKSEKMEKNEMIFTQETDVSTEGALELAIEDHLKKFVLPKNFKTKMTSLLKNYLVQLASTLQIHISDVNMSMVVGELSKNINLRGYIDHLKHGFDIDTLIKMIKSKLEQSSERTMICIKSNSVGGQHVKLPSKAGNDQTTWASLSTMKVPAVDTFKKLSFDSYPFQNDPFNQSDMKVPVKSTLKEKELPKMMPSIPIKFDTYTDLSSDIPLPPAIGKSEESIKKMQEAPKRNVKNEENVPSKTNIELDKNSDRITNKFEHIERPKERKIIEPIDITSELTTIDDLSEKYIPKERKQKTNYKPATKMEKNTFSLTEMESHSNTIISQIEKGGAKLPTDPLAKGSTQLIYLLNKIFKQLLQYSETKTATKTVISKPLLEVLQSFLNSLIVNSGKLYSSILDKPNIINLSNIETPFIFQFMLVLFTNKIVNDVCKSLLNSLVCVISMIITSGEKEYNGESFKQLLKGLIDNCIQLLLQFTVILDKSAIYGIDTTLSHESIVQSDNMIKLLKQLSENLIQYLIKLLIQTEKTPDNCKTFLQLIFNLINMTMAKLIHHYCGQSNMELQESQFSAIISSDSQLASHIGATLISLQQQTSGQNNLGSIYFENCAKINEYIRQQFTEKCQLLEVDPQYLGSENYKLIAMKILQFCNNYLSHEYLSNNKYDKFKTLTVEIVDNMLRHELSLTTRFNFDDNLKNIAKNMKKQ